MGLFKRWHGFHMIGIIEETADPAPGRPEWARARVVIRHDKRDLGFEKDGPNWFTSYDEAVAWSNKQMKQIGAMDVRVEGRTPTTVISRFRLPGD